MTIRLKQSLLLSFILFTSTAFAQNADINILKPINGHETRFKTDFFNAEAKSVTVFNIGAPLAVFTAGLIKHDKKLEKDAVYMLGAFAVSSLIVNGTKQLVKRNRPYVDYSFIVKRSSGGGYSFPSGHTSAAFTTATSLSLLFPKWYVIIPSYLFATSVGWARMYQGVHYPSDVLAGAFVGAGSAWLSWKVQKWMDKDHKRKKTIAFL